MERKTCGEEIRIRDETFEEFEKMRRRSGEGGEKKQGRRRVKVEKKKLKRRRSRKEKEKNWKR